MRRAGVFVLPLWLRSPRGSDVTPFVPFDESGSSDPEGPVLSSSGTYGDGASATGVEAPPLGRCGTCTVGLNLLEGAGLSYATVEGKVENTSGMHRSPG